MQVVDSPPLECCTGGDGQYICSKTTWNIYGRELKKLVTRIVFGEDNWESGGEKQEGE